MKRDNLYGHGMDILRTAIKIQPAVCDACRTAIYDEAPGTLTDAGDAEYLEIARTYGADIGDHVCDAQEAPDIACVCACRRPRRW